MMRSSVVLPQPDGPTIDKNSWREMSREISSKTGTRRPFSVPNSLRRLRIERYGFVCRASMKSIKRAAAGRESPADLQGAQRMLRLLSVHSSNCDFSLRHFENVVTLLHGVYNLARRHRVPLRFSESVCSRASRQQRTA